MPSEPKEVLKVAATSKPVLVAGAIAGVIRSQQGVEVPAVGLAPSSRRQGDRYRAQSRRARGPRLGM